MDWAGKRYFIRRKYTKNRSRRGKHQNLSEHSGKTKRIGFMMDLTFVFCYISRLSLQQRQESRAIQNNVGTYKNRNWILKTQRLQLSLPYAPMRLNYEEGVKRWEQEKTVRGGVGGENEGTLKVLFNKGPFQYTRFLYNLWLVYFDSSC